MVRSPPDPSWKVVRAFTDAAGASGGLSAVIHAEGHWQYAAMTGPQSMLDLLLPQTGAQLETPGMLAVAPFMDTSGWC